MIKLRHTLTAFVMSASLFGIACSETDAGNETANNTENIVESVMPAAPARPGKFDITRDKAGDWFFHLIGDKGQIYLASEAYSSGKSAAINGILSVEENGVLLDRYEVVPVAADDCTFVLKAGNGQVIGDGPSFRDCEAATAAVEYTRDLVAGVVQWKANVTQGAQFELWKEEADGQWYFVMRDAEGGIVLQSEGYTGRTGAVNGIESVRENGKQPAKYQIITEADGSLSISLKAGNGQEIADNGPYASEGEAQGVIDQSLQLLVSERVGNPW